MQSTKKPALTIIENESPSTNVLRERCGVDDESCPGEALLRSLHSEESKRIASEGNLAINIDRVADAAAAANVKLDRLTVEVEALSAKVASLANLRWWVAGIVAGIELARASGFDGVVKALLSVVGGQ